MSWRSGFPHPRERGLARGERNPRLLAAGEPASYGEPRGRCRWETVEAANKYLHNHGCYAI